MNGKTSLRKELNRISKTRRPSSTPINFIKIGKWIIQENQEGSLEVLNSENGDTFLLAE